MIDVIVTAIPNLLGSLPIWVYGAAIAALGVFWYFIMEDGRL